VLVGTPFSPSRLRTPLPTSTEIVEAVRSVNLADDPLREFLIDPGVHIGTRRRARERGLAVVGFYHSHPRSTPAPSPTDLERASYDDHWYLIVRPLVEGCVAGIFWLGPRGFEEHDLEVSNTPPWR
jgi:proteasome lid subunit RPN8/RPN11